MTEVPEWYNSFMLNETWISVSSNYTPRAQKQRSTPQVTITPPQQEEWNSRKSRNFTTQMQGPHRSPRSNVHLKFYFLLSRDVIDSQCAFIQTLTTVFQNTVKSFFILSFNLSLKWLFLNRWAIWLSYNIFCSVPTPPVFYFLFFHLKMRLSRQTRQAHPICSHIPKARLAYVTRTISPTFLLYIYWKSYLYSNPFDR